MSDAIAKQIAKNDALRDEIAALKAEQQQTEDQFKKKQHQLEELRGEITELEAAAEPAEDPWKTRCGRRLRMTATMARYVDSLNVQKVALTNFIEHMEHQDEDIEQMRAHVAEYEMAARSQQIAPAAAVGSPPAGFVAEGGVSAASGVEAAAASGVEAAAASGAELPSEVVSPRSAAEQFSPAVEIPPVAEDAPMLGSKSPRLEEEEEGE